MKKYITLLAVFSILTVSVHSYSKEKIVQTAFAFLYAETSVYSKIIHTFKSGDKVKVVSDKGAWLYIEVGSKKGYILKKLLADKLEKVNKNIYDIAIKKDKKNITGLKQKNFSEEDELSNATKGFTEEDELSNATKGFSEEDELSMATKGFSEEDELSLATKGFSEEDGLSLAAKGFTEESDIANGTKGYGEIKKTNDSGVKSSDTSNKGNIIIAKYYFFDKNRFTLINQKILAAIEKIKFYKRK